MIIIDLMLVLLLIYTVVLLSGKKMMYENAYSSIIIYLLAMNSAYTNFIEGYKLGYIDMVYIIIFSIIILLIGIWGYKINRHRYVIENVKEEDLMNILTSFLDSKHIKHEVLQSEIYLPHIDRSIIIVSVLSKTLNCRQIKKEDFYEDLIKQVRLEIKKTKRVKISYEGICSLIIFMFVCWMRSFL